MSEPRRRGFISGKDIFNVASPSAVLLISYLILKAISPISEAQKVTSTILNENLPLIRKNIDELSFNINYIRTEFLTRKEADVRFAQVNESLTELKDRVKRLEYQQRADHNAQDFISSITR